jgi:SAM-dependent methyltransferase
MDIVNRLSPRRFRTYDDLLAFISIYDDRHRTAAYRRLLRRFRHRIRNAVCMEAGCGLGIFTEELLRLGARKVYAVERNRLLYELARNRLQRYARVELIHADVRTVCPSEPIAVLVHDFYGMMLYDEELWVLEELPFRPELVLPNEGALVAGLTTTAAVCDRTVTPQLFRLFAGVLVSGLFDAEHLIGCWDVAHWRFGEGLRLSPPELSSHDGDVLFFYLSVRHDGEEICRAGHCSNWAYVWTPRCGDRFHLEFRQRGEYGTEVLFRWLA